MASEAKPLQGGNEDGIGISPGSGKSSARKNDLQGSTSAAGKILKQPVPEAGKKK